MPLLSACGGTVGTGSSGTAKVQDIKPGTLTVMSPTGEIGSDLVKSFETAYPQLKVNLINVDQTRLNAMLAAGNPPDLVEQPGTDVTPYIASQGIALNLDAYFEQSSVFKESDIMPVNDVWKWDGSKQGSGSRYGIAKDWSQDAMWWYDTQLWSAAGNAARKPTEPITYDELLDAAKAMTKTSGGKTSMYGLWYVTPDIDRIAAMVATAGGRIISEDLSTVDFTSPEAIKALTWIVEAGKAGVGYSVTNPSPDWDGPEMFAGKQATACQGYWYTGFTESTAPAFESKLQFNAAPLLGSTRISPSFGAVGFWVPAKAKNPGGSFAWLEWFCGGAGAKQRISKGDGLPSLKSMVSLLPQRNDFERACVATQNNELDYIDVVQVASPYALNTAINTTLAKDFPAAITGSMSVAKLADTLTTDVNAVLAAGKKALGK
ncbi:extracellular solute-binding protein [Actinospica sp. MGRD01-02]|uniref:Extracellular solute-binding protein n=1 Tax=Actinospica acidithermotolerans TaxID=2828514 RepID=A0A941EB61_9ACTN|nr:extracellular solute-binding protein [Actinospica acidithermotolerans]MBR7827212.1 extracellular solute-binding protein [Actinospica acidithermotolerans]